MKDKYYTMSVICGILKTKWTNQTKRKQTHRHREQSSSHQKAGGMVKRVKEVKLMVMDGNQSFGGEHTIVYWSWNIMLYTWNSYNAIK